MQHYKYLIVGGGLTGDAAVRGIRELDRDGSIGMFSMEQDPPYLRPALSKGLWKGRPMEKIWRKTEDLKVDMHLGRKVTQLDTAARRLQDDAGNEYSFEKLLLATGGSPKHLAVRRRRHHLLSRSAGLSTSACLERKRPGLCCDRRRLHRLRARRGTDLVGRKVTLILQEEAIGAKLFPAELSQYLNDYYRQKGVRVLTGDAVDNVVRDGPRLVVQTRNGELLAADGVVAGIGIRPNIELAEQSGLELEDGIIVDEQLRTSAMGVFAAGDVANFRHATLGKRVRVEHEDNAVHMGKQAGRNMAGANENYAHVPMFYSDLFDLGYEAVGEINSKLEIVTDWKEPLKKGVIYYLEDGRVRGVLLWNVWKQVDKARALLAAPGPFTADELMAGDGNVKQPSEPVLER